MTKGTTEMLLPLFLFFLPLLAILSIHLRALGINEYISPVMSAGFCLEDTQARGHADKKRARKREEGNTERRRSLRPEGVWSVFILPRCFLLINTHHTPPTTPFFFLLPLFFIWGAGVGLPISLSIPSPQYRCSCSLLTPLHDLYLRTCPLVLSSPDKSG